MGRIGGDEIAVIMPAMGERQVVTRVDEMRTHFATINQLGSDGAFSVTFSCAVAMFPRLTSAAALLNAASSSLASATRQGGNVTILAANAAGQGVE